jgi:hypothetical protein
MCWFLAVLVMVNPVMAHRVILRPESRLRKLTPAAILNEV